MHTNPDGLEKGSWSVHAWFGPHTEIMKTDALKQALSQHKFDVAFGGARRDEEKSRAKERVFSFRTRDHRWDPKNQRPELWSLYNTRKEPGESIRVFPLSNWTETDIWQYIMAEGIPIPDLYLARERPVVERDGTLIMVDDDRMPLEPGEEPSYGDGPVPHAGMLSADRGDPINRGTLPEIIQEMLLSKTSERQGRVIDKDAGASMEDKKQAGYF